MFPTTRRKAVAGMAFEAYGEAVVYRTRGAKAAAELGAVASLIRSVGGADYRLPHTGFSLPAGIPAALCCRRCGHWSIIWPRRAGYECTSR